MPGWPFRLVMQEPQAGTVGGSRLGCRMTSAPGGKTGLVQHNLHGIVEPLGIQGAAGPLVLPSG